jgi:hypothetical protein
MQTMSSDTRIAETLRTNRRRQENNIKGDLKGVASRLGWEKHHYASGADLLETLHQIYSS